ncbi:hypothetical protein [Candidatus Electrothrix sp.]|uniref:hypothetical protein n=1 Tax=Candidatus Electrothrix sp. TaxID=2170559 RepID=UPI004056FDA5
MGKNGSVAGESHPEAGERGSEAGKNGSVALQHHFLPLHPLIFRELLPSIQCRKTFLIFACLPATLANTSKGVYSSPQTTYIIFS